MNFLIIAPSFTLKINELSNGVYAYAEDLLKNGCQVEVFTPGSKSYKVNDIPEVRIPIEGSFTISLPIKGKIFSYIKFIRNHDADVLLCNKVQEVATDLALLFSKKSKIYHSHGISWQSGIIQNILYRFIWRINYFSYELICRFIFSRLIQV
jgi:hypothetical protein